MDNEYKMDKDLNQLGLPPMALAENRDGGRTRKDILIYTIVKGICMALIFILISAVVFLFLTKFIENMEAFPNTRIVIVSGDSSNLSPRQYNEEPYYKINDNFESSIRKRRKRNIQENFKEADKSLPNFTSDDYQKVKDIIINHDVKCNSESKNEICKDMVTKIKTITDSESNPATKNGKAKGSSSVIRSENNYNQNIANVKFSPVDLHKSDTDFLPHELTGIASRNAYGYGDEPFSHNWPSYPISHHPQSHLPHLTDTCLLARLLNHNYPHHQGSYDIPKPEYVPSHPYYSQPLPVLSNRYRSSLNQEPEAETTQNKIHPQDVELFMKYLTPKPEVTKPESNATVRDAQCPQGTLPCRNGEGCVSESQWCNGRVDCSDVSDEAKCSCKSRVDKSRLCDGYFDCPFGEDEMGCYGCSENAFSCEDLDINSKTTCFLKEHRCNNIVDCPNNRDELDCNMLSPSLHSKPLFAVSNTEGFLQRNFKGDWYAVCQNPYMWAHDACRRETGLIIRPPYIQIVPVNPTLHVNYLNTSPDGIVQTSDTCFNSSAIYITCPELLCGTRLLTSSSLIQRENTALENHLFGRNKRFLLNKGPQSPSINDPLKRFPRDNTRNVPNQHQRSTINRIGSTKTPTGKTKRAQSRVVGGKPSKPAAFPWVTAMYRDGMFHCGGVIITQYWILSAAHCVHEFWKHYYEVQVGMLRRFSFSPQEQNHLITHIIVNHHYNEGDMRNDVSLLKVKTAIRFSRWVRPICLPGPNTAGPEWRWGPPPGTACTAVGWGATVEHGPDPDHMRDVELPIWANCKHREDQEGNEICAGPLEGGKDACQGDSGGPLLCRSPLNSQQWYVAGIVSHGDGCARKGEPGVYTRVSLFVKWIRYHIGSNMLPTIQPVQRCPGFKCSSGIAKCLPDKRVCDKIVDCLNAEDEMNCKSERSFPDLFLRETKSDDILHKFESLLHPENTDGHADSKDYLTSKDNEKINSGTVDDFQHGSTGSEDSEHTTLDPTSMSREADFADNSFILTSPKTFLESRSLSLKPNKNNQQFRETDIQEDFSVNTAPVETTTGTNLKTSSTSELPIVSTIQVTTPLSETTSEVISKTLESNIVDGNNKNEAETKTLLTDLPESKVLPEMSNQKLESNDINDTPETRQLFSLSNVDKDVSATKNQFGNKLDIVHEIEDRVLSDLQPAKIRKQHRAPKHFECRRIAQTIPHSHRCDHKPDCEDGTDELGCTCVDYLFAFEKSLLCDGIFDCADGQDEVDCFSCPEDRFLCKRSQICLPTKNVCDGKPQCPQGEDEIDCFSLTNGKELMLNIDERPRISLEGYLTKRQKNKWHVVCEENLSTDQQKQAADHICRYLGFSCANSFSIKHINLKDEILKSKIEGERKKREIETSVPVHFTYRQTDGLDELSRHIVIKDPQVLKENCVPNVKKTCMALYVSCDHSLYNYDLSQSYLYGRSAETGLSEQMWPWVAKVFVEGEYKCSGVLVHLSLVLVSHSCLWDSSLNRHHVTVVLGSHRTLNSTSSPYEQILKVNGKRDLYRSNYALLHLIEPAQYTTMVKPMVVYSSIMPDEGNSTCVAVGQNENNQTISIFVEETSENCHSHNKCYKRISESKSLCAPGITTQQWAGVISCHTEQGWYPSATFVDIRGECGIQNHIIGTSIEDLKIQIRKYIKEGVLESNKYDAENCIGVRCGRGKCIDLPQVCDGVRNCEDGKDESEEACEKKQTFCENDPSDKECECLIDQFRCHSGSCIPKEQFNDGVRHCDDGTDEPEQSTCAKYLARVNPSRLCDGVLHCQDRSDEDPMFCKCFAQKTYPCGKTSNVNYCVAPDVVCDGVHDCPNGEDEQTCIGLLSPTGSPYGKGQVMVRSHGIWHTKCYSNKNHTRSELEGICRELGFISGHAKELDESEKLTPHPYNNVYLDPFSEVTLNNRTQIKIRNTHAPQARAIFDAALKDCYPVFIECL